MLRIFVKRRVVIESVMLCIARDKDNELYVFEDKPIRREDNRKAHHFGK